MAVLLFTAMHTPSVGTSIRECGTWNLRALLPDQREVTFRTNALHGTVFPCVPKGLRASCITKVFPENPLCWAAEH